MSRSIHWRSIPTAISLPSGSYFLYPNAGFHLARYSSSGALETAFGTGGNVTVNLGTAPAHSEQTAFTLQPDGKLLIGTHQDGSPVVMRYNQNGTLDTSFGTNGVATIVDLTGGSYQPRYGSVGAIAVLGSGQIVVAVEGHAPPASMGRSISSALCRRAGARDNTLGARRSNTPGLTPLTDNGGNVQPVGGMGSRQVFLSTMRRVLGLYPLQDGSVLVASVGVIALD